MRHWLGKLSPSSRITLALLSFGQVLGGSNAYTSSCVFKFLQSLAFLNPPNRLKPNSAIPLPPKTPHKHLPKVIFDLSTTSALLVVILLCSRPVHAQATASIEGQVTDQHGAIIPAVGITVISREIGIRRVALTDADGRYQIFALPVGSYRIEVRAPGFKTQVVESSQIEVGRTITQNFQLQLGDISQVVTVRTDRDLIEQSTMAIGHLVNQQIVQETPLNGRYFLDLGLRVPGSVTPPQGAFSASPARGLGSLAINTGGNREETVNYMVNGITLNNLTFSSISFQLPINSIQEFKLDNSTFSAQYGQSSGAIVNIATRSGANEFHGEVFEFFRNDALDARNFFEFTSNQPAPFKRNQFGGNLGAPIIKQKLFFFFSYEGLRQRQGLNLDSLSLSDAQRAQVTDPVIAK